MGSELFARDGHEQSKVHPDVSPGRNICGGVSEPPVLLSPGARGASHCSSCEGQTPGDALAFWGKEQHICRHREPPRQLSCTIYSSLTHSLLPQHLVRVLNRAGELRECQC